MNRISRAISKQGSTGCNLWVQVDNCCGVSNGYDNPFVQITDDSRIVRRLVRNKCDDCLQAVVRTQIYSVLHVPCRDVRIEVRVEQVVCTGQQKYILGTVFQGSSNLVSNLPRRNTIACEIDRGKRASAKTHSPQSSASSDTVSAKDVRGTANLRCPVGHCLHDDKSCV